MTMIHLADSLQAWNTPGFEGIFKREIRQIDAAALPLQQCLSQGSYAAGNDLEIMILSRREDHGYLHIKTGVFFHSRIPGCACADDPTPESDYTEYCGLSFIIDKSTAATRIHIDRDA